LKSFTAQQVQADLDKCTSLIVSATGTAPTIMRVPGGNYNENVIAYARKQNLQIIQWSVDTKDWKSKNKDAIISTAFQSGKYGIHDGAIVLMHDVYPTSVEAAVEMMDRLVQEGYTMVTVPELIRVRDNGGKAGNVYSLALKK
jgi:peptidoglycan/xylan/chitin deacetylase (PgdA/CDA1 family)